MIAVGALLYASRATNTIAPETRVDIVTPRDQRSLVLRALAGRAANRLCRFRRWSLAPVGALARLDLGAAAARY